MAQELLDLVSKYKPKLVFLMEVKVGRAHIETVRRKLGFDSLLFVRGVGIGGGIGLLWHIKDSVSLLSYSHNHVDVIF